LRNQNPEKVFADASLSMNVAVLKMHARWKLQSAIVIVISALVRFDKPETPDTNILPCLIQMRRRQSQYDRGSACPSRHPLTLPFKIRAIFKMLDKVRGQGVGRRKSVAYMGVCEHFEEDYNADIER